MKTHYDVIGVPLSATQTEIRKAFLLRSKMVHPDRFHESGQTDEWRLANELLQELNHAYGVLKSPRTRAEYDRSLPASTPPPSPAPSSTPPAFRPRSGRARFRQLPRNIQENLLSRQADKITNQFRMPLHGVRWHYCGALSSGAWFTLLLTSAGDAQWPTTTLLAYALITLAACALGAGCVAWIARYHRSPLKCNFYITPLYFIKTHLEELVYWPIWDVRNLKAVPQYRRGAYQGADVSITFPERTLRFRLPREEAYSWMISVMKTFDQKLRLARENGDWAYVYREDDFREITALESTPAATPPRPSPRVYGLSFAIGLALFAVALTINITHAASSGFAVLGRPQAAAAHAPPPNSVKAPGPSTASSLVIPSPASEGRDVPPASKARVTFRSSAPISRPLN